MSECKEAAEGPRGERAEGPRGVRAAGWLTAFGLLLLAAGAGAFLVLEVGRLDARLRAVEAEVSLLNRFIRDTQGGETTEERSRRHAAVGLGPHQGSPDVFSEDGVPVLRKKYKSYKRDNQGFRVYNAWNQHRRENMIKNDPRVVARHPTDAPIRAHHRKSAAWVNLVDDEDFLSFGSSMYKDPAPKRITILRSNSARNSINHGKNRVKITDLNEYKVDEAHVATTTTTTSTTTTTTTTSTTSSPLPATLNEHLRARQNSSQTAGAGRMDRVRLRQSARGARNRAMVRSGGRGRSRPRPRAAIHMEARVANPDGPGYEAPGPTKLATPVFTDWSPARWARRLRMEQKFALKDGRLTVSQPGIYYVYAQINYLDEHDVNAFQIYVNNSPFVLCTTMTHTPSMATKANTCFTGGVTFLEQGDQVYIKNLDENRFAVMLSSHSFFGLVQVSDMGI